MGSNARINREMKEMMKDNNIDKNGYDINPVNESSNHFVAKVCGPTGTAFNGGLFEIDIQIPKDYPFKPPKCKFMTKLWHPNVSSVTGTICLDILKDKWSPTMTLWSLLISIQSFLSSPEPNDPQDYVVANQYINKRHLYMKTAKYWTYIYAMDKQNREKINANDFCQYESLVNKLMEIQNLNRDQSIAVLSCNDWNLDKAIA